MHKSTIAAAAFIALLTSAASAQNIGSVNTEWKLTGSHKLVVEAFDDPKVDGITCYMSKPERGGTRFRHFGFDGT